jgi:hypothetical protein
MRANQFLLEYSRQITAQQLGNKILNAMVNTVEGDIPDNDVGLARAAWILGAANNPSAYRAYNSRLSKGTAMYLFGKIYIINNVNDAIPLAEEIKPKVIDYILNYIESNDPTPNHQYTQWMARAWANENGDWRLEDLNRNDILTAFHVGKSSRKIKAEHLDINKFKTYRELEKTMRENYDINELLGNKATPNQMGKFEIIHKDSDVTLVKLIDFRSSEYWGEKYGPKERRAVWCTLQPNKFNEYNSKGPLYVIKPNQEEYVGEKYQLHFPTSQFMDVEDEPVDLVVLLKQKYPQLEEVFKKIEPEIKDYVFFAPDDVLLELWSKIYNIADMYYDKILDEWIETDYDYQNLVEPRAKQLGYVTDSGEVDWNKIPRTSKLHYSKHERQAATMLDDLKTIKITRASAIRNMAARLLETVDYEEELTLSILPRLASDTITYSNVYGSRISSFLGDYVYVEKMPKDDSSKRSQEIKRSINPDMIVGDWFVKSTRDL